MFTSSRIRSEGTDARCPSAGEDVQTYVFTSSGILRCFQVYKPSSASAAPVVIMAHGANGNSRSFCGNKGTKKRFAALGTALVCTASIAVEGDKKPRWRQPEFGSTVSNPFPCTESDSLDLPYFETVLDWIAAQHEFDAQRIFNGGFSQGSNFASYISFCFHSRLRGFATSGSGLKVNGPAVEWCSAYDDPEKSGECAVGKRDGWSATEKSKGTCDDCRVFPIKPVVNATDITGARLRVCINVGEGDTSRVHGSDQYRYYYEKAGLRTTFTIHPGEKHKMPLDWPAIYDECLGITEDGTAAPTRSVAPSQIRSANPSTAPSVVSSCQDEDDFRFNGKKKARCAKFLRVNTEKKCNKFDKTFGRLIKNHCPQTCDFCVERFTDDVNFKFSLKLDKKKEKYTCDDIPNEHFGCDPRVDSGKYKKRRVNEICRASCLTFTTS